MICIKSTHSLNLFDYTLDYSQRITKTIIHLLQEK